MNSIILLSLHLSSISSPAFVHCDLFRKHSNHLVDCVIPEFRTSLQERGDNVQKHQIPAELNPDLRYPASSVASVAINSRFLQRFWSLTYHAWQSFNLVQMFQSLKILPQKFSWGGLGGNTKNSFRPSKDVCENFSLRRGNEKKYPLE